MADSKDNQPDKKESLDLLGDGRAKKKTTPKKVKEEKKESLDLLEGKKEARKKSDNAELPPISIIKDEKKKALEAVLGGDGDISEGVTEQEDTGELTDPNVIHLKAPIMIEALAEKMNLKAFQLIGDLIEFGVFANAKGSIEPDIAEKVCEKHGFVFEKEQRKKGAGVQKEEEVEDPEEPKVKKKKKKEKASKEDDYQEVRAPIITFMGHVDHGKTSLLDAIRKTKVVDGEAGGITQHIGAYTIEREGQKITFIDTPGHAAFTEMRSRGANVTDIVILVVAADDGLMPQTKEAISHAKAAGVSVIVAINKIDTKGADVNKVKAQLQEEGMSPVDFGGEIETVDVSAITGQGIDTLIETMLLQAEILELTANPKGKAEATVIEAKFQPGKGPTATVIIDQGTLSVGQSFICGPHDGKVKSLLSDSGDQVKSVGPAMAVEVIGFSELPSVGDKLVEMSNAREAKKLSEQRLEKIRKEKLEAGTSIHGGTTFESFIESLESEGPKTLNLLLKTDVAGTAEAIKNSLEEIKTSKVKLNFLLASAGSISESDVILAKASEAVILGFNVKVENKAVAIAKREGVEIRLYSIIYELIDQVRETMLGLLDDETREKFLGEAEVKQIFKLARRGRVAGCVVYKGKLVGDARARVIRSGQAVYDGGFHTLRRFQDDVKEVKNGLECGIRLGDYTEYEEGDIIQCYELENIEQKL